MSSLASVAEIKHDIMMCDVFDRLKSLRMDLSVAYNQPKVNRLTSVL